MLNYKFYTISSLIDYYKKDRIIKNDLKTRYTLKKQPPRLDELEKRYYLLSDLSEAIKTLSQKTPNTKLYITEIARYLKTSRQTLFEKMSWNTELNLLIRSETNYNKLTEIKKLFSLTKKQ